MNSAPMNTRACLLMNMHIPFCWIHTEGHRVYVLFIVRIYFLTVFQSGYANLYFHQQSMKVLVVSYTCQDIFFTYDKITFIWILLI